MNGYELSRIWFDWCFENPEKVKPNHTALYFFCIEHCNRLGWKKKFGLPTTMAKEALGMKSYNTYHNTLMDLVSFGFIEMVEKSKNQYSANIIALSKFNKALDNALDKATIKHTSKQSESTGESIDSIDKPITLNQEQERVYQAKQIEVLNFFGFSDAPKFISQQRLVKEFFYSKLQSKELKNFIEQFDGYKKYVMVGDNAKFKYSINSFLGDQKEAFSNGKWLNQNWVSKIPKSNQNILREVGN